MLKGILFLLMIFIHCIMDFCLQVDPIANMKQKSWWLKHPKYKESYKYDYISVLLIHGFSWSFGVQIPILLYNRSYTSNEVGWLLNIIIIIINTLIHAYIDDLKANRMKINLVQDQLLHMLQIVMALLIYFVFI